MQDAGGDGVAPPVKRKRGRPRKHPLPTSTPALAAPGAAVPDGTASHVPGAAPPIPPGETAVRAHQPALPQPLPPPPPPPPTEHGCAAPGNAPQYRRAVVAPDVAARLAMLAASRAAASATIMSRLLDRHGHAPGFASSAPPVTGADACDTASVVSWCESDDDGGDGGEVNGSERGGRGVAVGARAHLGFHTTPRSASPVGVPPSGMYAAAAGALPTVSLRGEGAAQLGPVADESGSTVGPPHAWRATVTSAEVVAASCVEGGLASAHAAGPASPPLGATAAGGAPQDTQQHTGRKRRRPPASHLDSMQPWGAVGSNWMVQLSHDSLSDRASASTGASGGGGGGGGGEVAASTSRSQDVAADGRQHAPVFVHASTIAVSASSALPAAAAQDSTTPAESHSPCAPPALLADVGDDSDRDSAAVASGAQGDGDRAANSAAQDDLGALDWYVGYRDGYVQRWYLVTCDAKACQPPTARRMAGLSQGVLRDLTGGSRLSGGGGGGGGLSDSGSMGGSDYSGRIAPSRGVAPPSGVLASPLPDRRASGSLGSGVW